MKILIDCDNTIAADRADFAKILTNMDDEFEAILPEERFHVDSSNVDPGEISDIYNSNFDIGGEYDGAILFTMTPYENNFFYEGIDRVFVISLFGWNHLTRVNMNVGIIYMTCSVVVKYLMGIGKNHDENVGCINDFWWDKTGVDAGMRAAFICDDCKKVGKQKILSAGKAFNFMENTLDMVSVCARTGKSVWDYLDRDSEQNASEYDIFLCHNTEDKEQVRELNKFLKNLGVRTWLDEEQVQPGDVWQERLEQAFDDVGACAVIVGDSGLGPWQNIELRTFISAFAQKRALIVPVLIGNAEEVPRLPMLLQQFQYLDLRHGNSLDASVLAGRLLNIGKGTSTT